MKAIREFKHEYRFLSNFYGSSIEIHGKWYKTVEHAYQAAKTDNEDEREKIRLAKTPGKAKRLANKIELREDWESVKFKLMYLLVEKKFADNDFKKRLLDTGDAFLEEGNRWHDNIWGNCFCDKCKNINGQNFLGEILMQVRTKLNKD